MNRVTYCLEEIFHRRVRQSVLGLNVLLPSVHLCPSHSDLGGFLDGPTDGAILSAFWDRCRKKSAIIHCEQFLHA